MVALSNELSTPKLIVCPVDRSRKVATNFWQVQRQHVSYFIGLDATTAQTNAFLSGDRNLMTNGRPVGPGLVDLPANAIVGWTKKIHTNQGNIVMADGSVQQFSTPRLAQALPNTGLRRIADENGGARRNDPPFPSGDSN